MIYLASLSPRRSALLRKAKLRFRVVRPSYKEIDGLERSPSRLTRRHALGKALSAAPMIRAGIVLAADTVVYCRGKIYGKPRNMGHAYRMMAELSGRWHTVLTGVVLLKISGSRAVKKIMFLDRTKVKIKKMDPAQTKIYFRKIRPLDKAGAYALQSPDISIVEEVRGSRTNVIGLPMEKLKMKLDMLR